MKNKKIPQRKCIITNEMRPKKDLIRVVLNKEGEVFIDQTGKKNGRGAYLILKTDIIEQAMKSDALSRQLGTKIPEDIYSSLLELSKEQNNES